VVHEDASVPGTGVEESAPELPAQRGPETGGRQALFDLPEQATSAEDDATEDEAAAENPDEVPAPSAPVLGPRERAVLEFERRRWKNAGEKEQAIREQFDTSPTNYFQILNALLDDPAALAHNPTLVARLRRLREARQQARR